MDKVPVNIHLLNHVIYRFDTSLSTMSRMLLVNQFGSSETKTKEIESEHWTQISKRIQNDIYI